MLQQLTLAGLSVASSSRSAGRRRRPLKRRRACAAAASPVMAVPPAHVLHRQQRCTRACAAGYVSFLMQNAECCSALALLGYRRVAHRSPYPLHDDFAAEHGHLDGAPAQRLLQTTERPHSDRSDGCGDGTLAKVLASRYCEAKSRALAFVRARPVHTRRPTFSAAEDVPVPCRVGAASQRVYRSPWGSCA